MSSFIFHLFHPIFPVESNFAQISQRMMSLVVIAAILIYILRNPLLKHSGSKLIQYLLNEAKIIHAATSPYLIFLNISLLSSMFNDVSIDLPNIINAINYLLSLTSIKMARADKKPAIAEFFLSSLLILLKKHKAPLKIAVIIAKNKPNLIESRFFLRFRRSLIRLFGLNIYGKYSITDLMKIPIRKFLYHPLRVFSKHPNLCLHMSVFVKKHDGNLIFSNNPLSSFLIILFSFIGLVSLGYYELCCCRMNSSVSSTSDFADL